MSQTTPAIEDEQRLLRRLHHGDRTAFRELYDAFSQRLYRQAIFPRVGLTDVAEDILRDTFLTAMEKINQVQWQGYSLYYWLARIAHNKVVDFYRANQRTDRFVKGFTTFLDAAAEPTSTQQNPEAHYLREETLHRTRQTIQAILQQLNPRYRRAIELRFFEELSREDCAATMEVTVGNFDVILFRAIQRMKTLYEGLQHDTTTP